MRRFLLTFCCLLGLSTAAGATCTGQDLRATLTPEDEVFVEQSLGRTPFATGNHWKAVKDDEEIHLIGTMHLADPRLDGPYTRLRPLIQNAGVLLLEMTATEQAEMEQTLASRMDMLILQGSSLPDLMDEDDWQMLSAAIEARGLPPVMAAKLQPWYVSMLLAVPACLQAALTEKNGLDARLEALADVSEVPTRALEPFDTALDAFGQVPLDMQVKVMLSALTGPQVGEDMFETLLAGYFEEAHAEIQIVLELLSPRLTPLDESESQQVYQMFTETLINQRNQAWIPVILDAAAQTDGPVVAAFGAGHLSGDQGVLQLLADQGFVLTQEPF
ncbi:TraB/GumN family protein [Tropicibacter naphthalenivorans]|uniref:TraB family protein n=1 Tax=Tropicibacter naphthalenivorans TaxID=441103 RepID=A0A0P1GB90_9RHOB|nr:TraB/GumN family protein [Tropicibacter naphthalenivorans]CUH78664.1 TraB family protein [Tropicibacter naphthalenivorans]SMC81164.1 hypothetical protein SAMN04488093_104261 [Tropicibacter naphthalenivorans]